MFLEKTFAVEDPAVNPPWIITIGSPDAGFVVARLHAVHVDELRMQAADLRLRIRRLLRRRSNTPTGKPRSAAPAPRSSAIPNLEI